MALFVVVMAFSLAMMIVVELTGGVEKFRGMIDDAGAWAPVVYVTLKISTYVVAPLSGTTIEMAAGALFGVWIGLALSIVGTTIGACLNYWIARQFGRVGIAKFAGKKSLARVDDAALKIEDRIGGWRGLVGVRIFLSPFYDFISYAVGLVRFPFIQFVLVTAIGGIPVTLLWPLIGDATASNDSAGFIVMIIFAVLLAATIGALLRHRYKQSRTKAG